jgi:hypothetical protein
MSPYGCILLYATEIITDTQHLMYFLIVLCLENFLFRYSALKLTRIAPLLLGSAHILVAVNCVGVDVMARGYF